MKKPDAERAMQRYNNVSLDGKAMQIELVAPTLGGRVVETLTSGLRCEPAAEHHLIYQPMNSSAADAHRSTAGASTAPRHTLHMRPVQVGRQARRP